MATYTMAENNYIHHSTRSISVGTMESILTDHAPLRLHQLCLLKGGVCLIIGVIILNGLCQCIGIVPIITKLQLVEMQLLGISISTSGSCISANRSFVIRDYLLTF
jgi:hypothetical protein